MPTAKKLPSGSYRVQVYSHKDSSGKKHYVSFTADTKKEAEKLANNFSFNRNFVAETGLVVIDAIKEYVDSQKNIKSPSTIAGYKSYINMYSEIEDIPLKKINNKDIQKWVNGLAKDKSPKTIKNIYGLLKQTLVYNNIRIDKVSLPKSVSVNYILPSDNDIRLLTDFFKKNDKDMLVAIYIASMGTLRRSEACALTYNDIQGNCIYINKAMVKTENREWVVKTTKNESSTRYVELPEFIINFIWDKYKEEKIKSKNRNIIKYNPDQVTHYFGRTRDKLHLPKFRYHDLRHYSASILHAMGIPDQYIQERGGWKNDKVLKQVYRNTLSDYSRLFNEKANSYFSENFNTDNT